MPNNMTPPSDPVTQKWLHDVGQRFTGVFHVPGYTIASLPTASEQVSSNFTGLAYVTDDVGGPTLAFVSGTNGWVRVQDLAALSTT